MAVRVTTEPTIEPVSLSEAKLQCRVDGSDEDTIFASLIKAARRRVEAWEWRKHLTQTLTLTLDGRTFQRQVREHGALYLPFAAPLQSVTSVSYLDDEEDSATWASADYVVDTSSEPGRLYPTDHEFGTGEWFEPGGYPNAVTVVYVCGHTSADLVPEETKVAIRLLVSHLYNHREAVSDRRMAEIPMGVEAFLRKCHDPRVLEFV